MCEQPVRYLHIQQIWSNISTHLELCFCPPDECKSNIDSSISALVSTNSWEKYPTL